MDLYRLINVPIMIKTNLFELLACDYNITFDATF